MGEHSACICGVESVCSTNGAPQDSKVNYAQTSRVFLRNIKTVGKFGSRNKSLSLEKEKCRAKTMSSKNVPVLRVYFVPFLTQCSAFVLLAAI